MSELILYNYPLSPFSEKIRLMLGYTGLPWQSVEVMEAPPRPVIDVLVGGYRKIPVAQIGADVFCDTKTITTEIARLSGKPELALENCSEEIQTFVQKTDSEVFMALVIGGTDASALVELVKRTSLLRTIKFLWDRVGIARKAKIRTLKPREAKAIAQQHLNEMESILKDDFLFGDAPCIADFSAYHSLWLVLDMKGMTFLKAHPRVTNWFSRMQAFGHGENTDVSDDQVLDIALKTEPRALGDAALAEPRQVSVAPSDYARDPVTGLLVGENDQRWILRREHPRIGTVHLHFPKEGFSLKG